MAKTTPTRQSTAMMSNTSYCLNHTVTEDTTRVAKRVIMKDDIAVVTDDMSMFDGISASNFSTSSVVSSGDNLKPIPKTGFDDGVRGRDRLDAQYNEIMFNQVNQ